MLEALQAVLKWFAANPGLAVPTLGLLGLLVGLPGFLIGVRWKEREDKRADRKDLREEAEAARKEEMHRFDRLEKQLTLTSQMSETHAQVSERTLRALQGEIESYRGKLQQLESDHSAFLASSKTKEEVAEEEQRQRNIMQITAAMVLLQVVFEVAHSARIQLGHATAVLRHAFAVNANEVEQFVKGSGKVSRERNALFYVLWRLTKVDFEVIGIVGAAVDWAEFRGKVMESPTDGSRVQEAYNEFLNALDFVPRTLPPTLANLGSDLEFFDRLADVPVANAEIAELLGSKFAIEEDATAPAGRDR